MTNEDKNLLLKDLCARLPYGVIVQIQGRYDDGEEYIRETEFDSPMFGYLYDDEKTIIPYLRPMSSMTKDERAEMGKAIQKDYISPDGEIKSSGVDNLLLCSIRQATNLIDWFNANHFDYRGLIEKGLALEAPEGMYEG